MAAPVSSEWAPAFARCFVPSGLVLASALSLPCLGCTGDDAQFNVKYATDFAENGATISVFGVFRDGRLSPEAWQEFGPTLSAPFGKGMCDGAYTGSFISQHPALSSAADDYVKENGITDELLDRFAPAAEGKAILALAVVGHPPRKATGGSDASARASRHTQPDRPRNQLRSHFGSYVKFSRRSRSVKSAERFE